ncbi:hypothetical protein OE88DRAFT_872324 [Heliocybe sulcata]|uniref:Aminoglycoside phosphotransferase domain-containing protein n=1 Tax=Heliocybe sulcata TaxID=5364 RepID=A0A5C3MN85_9AGAM|nr:hypothetical protein OE88DRAFT_872324 [Heliocybe sulcata]
METSRLVPLVCVFSGFEDKDSFPRTWAWVPNRNDLELGRPTLFGWTFSLTKLLTKLNDVFNDPPVRFTPFPLGDKHNFCVTFMDGTNRILTLPESVLADKHGNDKYSLVCEETTSSCVAAYAGVPIRRPIHYHADPENKIGTPFLVSQHVTGVTLHEAWPLMSLAERSLLIRGIGTIWGQLLSIRLPYIGRLTQNAGSGNVTVGPLYLPSAGGERGPFLNIKDWLVEMARGSLRSESTTTTEQQKQMDIAIHKLMHDSPLLDEDTLAISKFNVPVLFHPYMDAHHILVDPHSPTTIRAVIGWHHACSFPLSAITLPDLGLPGCDDAIRRTYLDEIDAQISQANTLWRLKCMAGGKVAEHFDKIHKLKRLARNSDQWRQKGFSDVVYGSPRLQ